MNEDVQPAKLGQVAKDLIDVLAVYSGSQMTGDDELCWCLAQFVK